MKYSFAATFAIIACFVWVPAIAGQPKLAPVNFGQCMNTVYDVGGPVGESIGNAKTEFSKLKFTLADQSVGNNVWEGAGGGSITIKFGKPVDSPTVYTVMNTEWGQDGIANAFIHFIDIHGDVVGQVLIGNTDIRDYNNWVWTNTINGTTTQEWWTNNLNPVQNDQSHRLDVQKYTPVLPGPLREIINSAPSDSGPNYMEPLLYAVGIDANKQKKIRTTCSVN